MNNVSSEANFGDTATLFEAINEEDLQEKIKDTFENITSMFSSDTDASGNIFDNLEKMTQDLMEGIEGDVDEDGEQEGEDDGNCDDKKQNAKGERYANTGQTFLVLKN